MGLGLDWNGLRRGWGRSEVWFGVGLGARL